jgi:hypothetical protein
MLCKISLPTAIGDRESKSRAEIGARWVCARESHIAVAGDVAVAVAADEGNVTPALRQSIVTC